MIGKTYTTVELRYAGEELSKNNFVKEKDYLLSRKYGRSLLHKFVPLSVENSELKEAVEILINQRNHWHHMYNQATAPDNTPLDFSLVENVVPV